MDRKFFQSNIKAQPQPDGTTVLTDDRGNCFIMDTIYDSTIKPQYSCFPDIPDSPDPKFFRSGWANNIDDDKWVSKESMANYAKMAYRMRDMFDDPRKWIETPTPPM